MQAEVNLALKCAVLAAEYSKAEIARLTGATPAEIRAAFDRLKRAAPAIDRDAPPDF